MSEETYTIDLKEICSVYERTYVPVAARGFSGEQRAAWTFTILPYSEADNVADTEFTRSMNSPTVAEVRQAQEAAEQDPAKIAALTALIERDAECRRLLWYWRLRRFMRPPAGFERYWDFQPPSATELAADDPLRELPGALVGELHDQVWKMIMRSVRYLPGLTNENDSGAEAAAGK